jgi:hypothetical protein
VQGSGYLTACFAYAAMPGSYVLGVEKYPELAENSLEALALHHGKLLHNGNVDIRSGNIYSVVGAHPPLHSAAQQAPFATAQHLSLSCSASATESCDICMQPTPPALSAAPLVLLRTSHDCVTRVDEDKRMPDAQADRPAHGLLLLQEMFPELTHRHPPPAPSRHDLHA